MYAKEEPSQQPSSTTSYQQMEAPTASAPTSEHPPSSYHQQQQPSYEQQSQQPSYQPPPPPQQQKQPAPTQQQQHAPYQQQEGTWWEESNSPHPNRTDPGQLERGTGSGHGDNHRNSKEPTQHEKDVALHKCARIVCAILLPPLGVFLQTGCDSSFVINVLLTILGYLPGILHALYVILTAEE